MATFEYSVTGQSITTTKAGRIVSGTVGVYTVKFTFDSSWDGLEKWASFDPNPGQPYKQPLDANGECEIPGEVMGGVQLRIGAFGLADGQAYPTVWANKLSLEEGCFVEIPMSDWPEPAPIIEGILEELENKVDKPESATAGNVAIFDNNKNIADSGIGKDNLILSPQLSSHIYAEDQTPYLYRQTGGGVEVGTREYDSIVGGSIVHNQLLDVRTASTTVNGITASTADGIITVTGTASANADINLDKTTPSFKANHIYYFKGANGGSASTFAYFLTGSAGSGIYGITMYMPSILKATAGRSEHFRLRVFSGATVNIKFAPKIIDLTEEFGSTVADRIFALYGGANTGTAEPFIESIGQNGIDPYTAEPSLLSAMPTAHKTVGFNQWDEEWEQAIINASGAVVATGSNYLASKNFIPVFQNTTYYMNWNDGTGYVAEYDATQTYITMVGKAKGATYTPSSNCRYIRFYKGYSVPYQQNICINISDPLRNGTYEPYEEHTYPLAGVELRGVPAVDSAGNIYFDGDTYAPDGTVVRRYAVLTIDGTEVGWNKSSTKNGSFYLAMGSRNYKSVGNVICAKLITVHSLSNYAVGCLYPDYNDISFWFADGVDKTLDQFKAWLSSNPFTIIYEAKTPSTETATSYDALQISDPLGTEEYVDERPVPVPVGHVTKYPVDQVRKLDGLPSDFSTLIAPTEKAYTATRAYAVGRLLIVDNQLYKVQTAIASGATLTVGTNITATTLDEVIASL